MDIIKDNPFWGEKRVYSKAEAWIYLQKNDISINSNAKLFGWSTTKLYSFLEEINKSDRKKVKPTIKKTLEQRKKEFANKLIPFIEKYGKEIIREFYDYWSEHNDGGLKMAFEKKSTFSIEHRLRTWNKNNTKYGTTATNKLEDSAKRKREILEYYHEQGSGESDEVVF